MHSSAIGDDTAPTVFLFPGQGSQHHQMAPELFDHEPDFRDLMLALDDDYALASMLLRRGLRPSLLLAAVVAPASWYEATPEVRRLPIWRVGPLPVRSCWPGARPTGRRSSSCCAATA